MKVFNWSIMLSVHLNCFLLFLSLFAAIFAFPSTPLNERNQEISWEAWLLVDDQNNQQQQRQASDAAGQIPRRRITPKSVFVAPTFSPEDLPPCAEGYSSDPMGRCVKIIKLDEDKHLDFLVSKLNEKFGSSLDYEVTWEIDESNAQPTRLDIPLDFGDDYSNDTPQEELDMAIIVTPTTRDISDKGKMDENGSSKLGKRDDTPIDDKYEDELKLLKLTTTIKYDGDGETTTNFKLDDSELSESELLSTTVSNPQTTTFITDEEIATTTLQTVEDTTTTISTTTIAMEASTEDLVTEPPSTNIPITTTTPSTTTITAADIVDTTNPSRTTTTTITTTTPKITTYHPLATTYHPFFDLNLLSNSKTKNLVKFPSDEPAIARSHPEGNYVRFPDVDTKYQQESQGHHTRQADDQAGNFFNEIVTPQPSEKIQEMVLPPKGIVKNYYAGFNNYKSFQPKFFPSSREERHPVTATEQLQQLKKKDRHMIALPPKWSSDHQHKPMVLRFSRKHFNLDANKFKNSEFYRSVPMDDLTYLFGYKNGPQTTHR